MSRHECFHAESRYKSNSKFGEWLKNAVNEASTDEHDTQCLEWIEEHIKWKHIKRYEYEGFNKLEEIGVGLVGKVYKENWERSGMDMCGFKVVKFKQSYL